MIKERLEYAEGGKMKLRERRNGNTHILTNASEGTKT